MDDRPASSVTVAELIRHGEGLLRPSDSSRLDAELLLGHVLELSRTMLYRDGNVPVAIGHREQFRRLLRARADGQPIAQLLGGVEFWSLAFIVDENVLIPRPETELLVETALERMPRSGRPLVADLGTGSGAIAVVLAVERPGATVVATDKSALALRIAQKNCDLHEVSTIQLVRANLLDGMGGNAFDLVVSNPPYVCAGDPLLSTSDIRFEPEQALAAGEDGLEALRTITCQTPASLKPGGSLIVEHGYNQGAAVRRLFEEQGFQRIKTSRDLAGLQRVTYGEKREQ